MTGLTIGAGAAGLLAFGLLVAWLVQTIGRDGRIDARLLAVQRAAGVDQVVLPWSMRRLLLRGLASIGRLLTRAVSCQVAP